jgi:hypothetical protein
MSIGAAPFVYYQISFICPVILIPPGSSGFDWSDLANWSLISPSASVLGNRSSLVAGDRCQRSTIRDDTRRTSFIQSTGLRMGLWPRVRDADIDVFVVVHPQYFAQNGQSELLDRVKRVITKTYPDSKISRAGQAVTVRFSDFHVDVVPGFHRQGGGYLIPDAPGRRWIATDPKRHVELWSARNSEKGGRFIPLVKMLKGWNKDNGESLRSFHLECIAYDVMAPYTIDYPASVRYVLDQARNRVQNGVLDPAGYGGNVGAYLDTQAKKDAVITRLRTAFDLADEAERFAHAGYISIAYAKWRSIFGDYFPAYG